MVTDGKYLLKSASKIEIRGNATSPSERLIRKLEREEVYQEIQNSRGIHDLLTNGTIFFTNRLLSEPVDSFKVKAISEMERIEKLLKE